MQKRIVNILSIFILGIAGGVFGSQILWPLLAERPLFYQYRLDQAPTYITERNEVIVQENTALVQAADRVKKSVVGIKAGGVTGSGLVLTSDGLLITLNDLLPRSSQFVFVVDGQTVTYQILKRDLENNLVLVKLDKSGLSATGFADSDRLRPGQRVFLAAKTVALQKDGVWKENSIVAEGVVRSFEGDILKTTIFEDASVRGSPLFDIEGNVAGLNLIDARGRVVAISSAVLRKFAGF